MGKGILHALNYPPVAFTIKHYQTFGDSSARLKDGKLDSAESWDVLREQHPHFSISDDRGEWLRAAELEVTKDGQDGGVRDRAGDIARLIEAKRITTVFSVGIGGGALEYQLKKLKPALRVIGSEYAPKNVERLKRVFLEADDIIPFDITSPDWSPALSRSPDERVLCLMYRVDPHFTDREWREVFERMHRAGVERVLYIPCGFLSLRSWFQRKRREWRWKRGGQSVVFAGYLRTKKMFERYWKGLYEAEESVFGGLHGFYLQKKP